MRKKTAVIIGAGPAGLTAALEILKTSDVKPVVFEMTSDIGGISKTINYRGNRIDIGGHRFFSKSDRVMAWWQDILPLQGAPASDDLALLREVSVSSDSRAPDPEQEDRVMLVRSRMSRIFFLRAFFDYPISLTWNTFKNLGMVRSVRIGFSYLSARVRPVRNEKSLEDFLVNRFGRELFNLFFRDYTRKVWGVPCSGIPPEWGAQRIKGLSITRAIAHALKRVFTKDSSLGQKSVETSLIEQFLYPKLGPGQLWEEVARRVVAGGGEIHFQQEVVGIEQDGLNVSSVQIRNIQTGEVTRVLCDALFSSMPVRELIPALNAEVPEDVRRVAAGLQYRDFITVGLLLEKMNVSNHTSTPSLNNIIPDNWIYIQEGDVMVGRIQIFNNWSPYMVRDQNTVWVGLEYFCNELDETWQMDDQQLIDLAGRELERIGLASRCSILDATVIRMPKAYPAYFGSYDQFDVVRSFADQIENLFLIGRNGMHRYNNADHSMLTAMTAVEHWLGSQTDKSAIWAVNTEGDYHEQRIVKE
jgi:protoporphyrinogen oxidase